MSSTRIAPSEMRTPVRVLKVEIDRSSPAYAALEDSRSDYYKTKVAFEGEILGSGETFVFHRANAQPKIEIAAVVNEREMPALAVAVEGSTEFDAPTMIDTAQLLVQQELKKRQADRELRPFKVTASPQPQTIYTQSGSPITIQRMPSTLATSSARVIAAAAPTTAFRDPFAPAVPSRVVAVNFNPSKLRKPASSSLSRTWLPSTTIASAGKPTTTVAFNDTPKSNLGFTSLDGGSQAFASTEIPNVGLISVRGPIKFVKGMAFSPGDDEIKIYQEYGSGYLAAGAFYFNQGQYQIPITEAKGRIIAEVRNREGDLIGRGQIDIRTLADRMQTQSIINEMPIDIAPAQSAFVGEVLAAASSFKTLSTIDNSKLVIADLNREIIREPREKIFVDQGFRLGSTALVKGSAQGHWSSLAIAESGSPIQLGLFSDNVVSAMLTLASKTKYEARENEDKAIISGRITIEGKPVADATITLLSEPDIKAVYFNGVIPDRQRVTTSANGEFVFVGVTNPTQVIQATINGRKQVPLFAFVENKAVTQVDYVVSKAKEIKFSAFHNTTQAKLPMRFNFVGSEKYSEMLRPMSKIVKKALPRGLSMVEFDAGEVYAMTRVALDGNEREVSAPMFPTAWANSIGKGLVVGQIEGENYMVSFDGIDFTEAKIQYLDNDGHPTDAVIGQAGQRFVVTGLSQGFHTITITPQNSRQVMTQIVYVDEHAIHYIKKTISE